MKKPRTFLWHSTAAILDQILLSALNFLIGILLIKFASKSTYGLYSQLFAGSLLSATLLNALLGSALTTLSAKLDIDEKKLLISNNLKIQIFLSLIISIASAIFVWFIVKVNELSNSSFVLALSFGCFLFTSGCREYCRMAFFIKSKPENVFILDAIYVVVSIFGGAFVYFSNEITVTDVMFLLAFSNGLSFVIYGIGLVRLSKDISSLKNQMQGFGKIWKLSRWALCGALVGWSGNNFYLYLTSSVLGISALADLSAARLAIIPISMLGTAWAKVATPFLGRFIHDENNHSLFAFQIKSIFSLELFSLIYLSSLFLILPWVSHVFLNDKYNRIFDLIFLWGIYFSVNVARNVSTTLIATYGNFHALFWQGVMSLGLLVSLSFFGVKVFGVDGIIYAMIAIEAFEIIVNYLFLIPLSKKSI